MKRSHLPWFGLVLLSTVALAQTKPNTVREATGEAAIIDGNQQQAFEQAKRAALREAVEQAAGILVSSDTLVRNNEIVADRIFANSQGYVRSYDVVSRKVDGNVLRVTLKVVVGTADLDRDLQAVQSLIARFGNRKLVIILQEQAIDQKGVTTTGGVMAGVLTEGFKTDGWTMIDPAFAAGKLRLASGVAVGGTEAKEIGDLTRADYILYGTVNFRYQSIEGTMMAPRKGQPQQYFPVSGEYDLTVFATDSGSQIAKLDGKLLSDPREFKADGGSMVLSYERTAHDVSRIRGKAVLKQTRAAVIEYLRNAEQNGQRLVMNVVGLGHYKAVRQFQQTLAALTGMRDVRSDSFKDGQARFDLTFSGSADALADQLGGKKFQRQTINVTGVTANTVELTLAK